MTISIPSVPFQLEKALAFFDLETTGISVQTDRIVEIAVVKFLPRGGTKEFAHKVNPEMPIPAEATAVHGISNADVALEPTFANLAPRLIEFLRDCDLSGFNIRRFDLPMLMEEFKRAGMELDMSDRHVIDALTIFHTREPRDLTAALRFYCGKEHTGAHGALADVYATAEVFAAQLVRYDDLPKNIAQLEEMIHPKDPCWVDDDGKFVWQDGEVVISFGKHRGKSLKTLLRLHRDYLEWVLSGSFPESAKIVIREALLGRFPSAPAQ